MQRMIFAALLLMTASAWADVYSWVDEKGVKHFSNNPADVPASATTAEETQHSGPLPLPSDDTIRQVEQRANIRAAEREAKYDAGMDAIRKQGARDRLVIMEGQRRRLELSLAEAQNTLQRRRQSLDDAGRMSYTNIAARESRIRMLADDVSRAENRTARLQSEIADLDARMATERATATAP